MPCRRIGVATGVAEVWDERSEYALGFVGEGAWGKSGDGDGVEKDVRSRILGDSAKNR